MGAWIETPITFLPLPAGPVAPYVGAWIETEIVRTFASDKTSHPTWVRGLKLHELAGKQTSKVAPYVGAWIETAVRCSCLSAR